MAAARRVDGTYSGNDDGGGGGGGGGVVGSGGSESSSGVTIDERPEPVEEKRGLDEKTIELFFEAAVDERADEVDEDGKVAEERLDAEPDDCAEGRGCDCDGARGNGGRSADAAGRSLSPMMSLMSASDGCMHRLQVGCWW